MAQFYVVNESSEDTLYATDNCQDAVRFARQAAEAGQAGDPVSVLDERGKGVRQFVLMPDGTIEEPVLERQVKP